ncbi:hypothetical protein C8J57DRAFT_1594665 [Mycena rebaudengoi]|nr:hypothetical protein C8J57DRAFT_1594665 [Mycena rebaudengoi]
MKSLGHAQQCSRIPAPAREAENGRQVQKLPHLPTHQIDLITSTCALHHSRESESRSRPNGVKARVGRASQSVHDESFGEGSSTPDVTGYRADYGATAPWFLLSDSQAAIRRRSATRSFLEPRIAQESDHRWHGIKQWAESRQSRAKARLMPPSPPLQFPTTTPGIFSGPDWTEPYFRLLSSRNPFVPLLPRISCGLDPAHIHPTFVPHSILLLAERMATCPLFPSDDSGHFIDGRTPARRMAESATEKSSRPIVLAFVNLLLDSFRIRPDIHNTSFLWPAGCSAAHLHYLPARSLFRPSYRYRYSIWSPGLLPSSEVYATARPPRVIVGFKLFVPRSVFVCMFQRRSGSARYIGPSRAILGLRAGSGDAQLDGFSSSSTAKTFILRLFNSLLELPATAARRGVYEHDRVGVPFPAAQGVYTNPMQRQFYIPRTSGRGGQTEWIECNRIMCWCASLMVSGGRSTNDKPGVYQHQKFRHQRTNLAALKREHGWEKKP